MNFQERFRSGVATVRGPRGRILARLAEDEDFLANVEAGVRKSRGLSKNAAIDWSKVPWKEIMAVLIPLLFKTLGL